MSESWEILEPGWAVFYWPVEEDEKRFEIIRKAEACYYQPVCSNVSGEDRARLIAAAPEMLAELESVRDDLRLLEHNQLRLESYNFERIDAVIAKARGE